jgi:hypothetical protein
MRQKTFGKPTPKKETEYAQRLKAQFKRRLEELDSRRREADYILMMPTLNIDKAHKDRKEKARRDRKLIIHKRAELLKEIKKTWREYKGIK